jgi:CelD/BcsL family acetyltransferase involved in cellulose biosynthesis
MMEDSAYALEVVAVATESGFLDLETAWNAVALTARPRSVFLRHEWFAAAWSWRRLQARLRILIARRQGVIVGILPLIRSSASMARGRAMELLTVPDTQVADLICAPENADEVAHAFATTLRRDRSWDTLFLDALQPEGPAMKFFKRALERRGLAVAQRDGGINFLIDLNGAWNDYYGTRSRSLKKAMNLAANRLRGTGEVQIACLESRRGGDEAPLRAAIETVIEISARSWKRATGNSLDQPGPQAFIRHLSERALEKGWLAIWLLCVDGKPLAMEYDLVFEGNVHALRADFDASCTSTSPGAFLFRAQLEQLFGHGLNRYYMGRGENPYKLRWTDQGDPVCRIVAYNRTPIGFILRISEHHVKRALRTVRNAIWNAKNPTGDKGTKAGAPE